MKKVISLKKILALAFAIFACHSVLAYDFEADGIYYNIISEDDRTVEVAQNGLSYSGKVVIPSEVYYNYKTYTVTAIAVLAFNYTDVTSVEIPGSITTIGDHAFYFCLGLTTVEIPNSVITIGLGAFMGCAGLREINVDKNNKSYVSEDGVLYTKDMNTLIQFPGGKTSSNFQIPKSVNIIGESAFYNCVGLASVEIPNSVITIETQAFSECQGLTSIDIPNSVTTIGSSAFYNCDGLTSVEIPNSVTGIEQGAFTECDGLCEINVDENNQSYASEDGVLYTKDMNTLMQFPGGKTSSNFQIPNSVTVIAAAAFAGCDGLTLVDIPNSVSTIGDIAFNECNGLTLVEIPNSVTDIGWGAFVGCDNLHEINVDKNNQTYVSEDGVLYTKDMDTIIQFPNGKILANFKVPDSVVTIGEYAFYHCLGLTSVEIPNSVTIVEDYAFYHCI